MRGVPDEQDAAPVPLFLLHPLDSRTVNLLIALDRSQIFLNRSPEFGKAFAQSLQSAPHFIVDVQVGHMPKAVCVPVSHRASAG